MFAFFSFLIVLALVTFGAVQTHALLFIAILWLAGLVILVCRDALASRPLGFDVIATVAMTFVVIFLDYKLAIGVLALGWGWVATRKSPLSGPKFLQFLVVVGALEACLGLIQYFVAPGWIFGYQNIYAISSGTLINRNHFAGLLEMIVPATVGLAFAAMMRGQDKGRIYFHLFAGAFVTVAIVFSTSRMGLLSVLLTLLFLSAILRLKNTGKGSTTIALVVLGLVATGALWIGIDGVVQRFEGLNGRDAIMQESRLTVYAGTLRMISAHPFGLGIGSYRDVFRRYQTDHPELLMDHAHNDYLETASEWGILPALVFWILIFVILGRAVKSFLRTQSPERAAILIASMGAIFSILLHSITDFNLQIPLNAMLFLMFVGIAARASSPTPFPSPEVNAVKTSRYSSPKNRAPYSKTITRTSS